DAFRRTQSPVKVDLPIHIIPCLQIIFDGVYAACRNEKTVVFLVYFQRFKDPFQVEDAVFDPSHQRIAEQVIHAVCVELGRHDLAERERTKIAANDGRNAAGKFGVEFAESPADGGLFAFDGSDGEILVMKSDNRFDHVRESPVADVVQKSCASNGDAVGSGDLVFRRKL